MIKKLKYKFHSGKNSKFKMYALGYVRHLVPRSFYTIQLDNIIRKAKQRDDFEYLMDRINYYNKLTIFCQLSKDTAKLTDFDKRHQNAYYIDLFRTSRWFDSNMKCDFCPGDVTFVPEVPSIVKSRPIAGNNTNSIVLKLDRTRHFVFLKDKMEFNKKRNMAIFRGGVTQAHRIKFMQMYFNDPLVDAAEANKHMSTNPPEWRKERITLYDHLQYKFIISLEGNDVASNLKWVMSSNSIAVMPKPKYETWFMEGRLKGNFHYIEIKDDYSDLPEKLNYYINHEEEALEIIKHAHEYVNQFMDEKRENLLEILVLNKYFGLTNV